MLRGYLANAEKVRVRGAEFDANGRMNTQRLVLWRRRLHRRQVPLASRRAAAARGHRRTAGQGHLRVPILPGISKWAISFGGEVRRIPLACLALPGASSAALDTSYRSSFSSSASDSSYLVVDGYSLLNVRVGFRSIAAGRSSSGRATCWTRTTSSC